MRSTSVNRLRYIALFYSSMAVPCVLATAFCVWMIVREGPALVLPAVLLKAAILGVAWFVRREYGNRTLHYFTNLGLSPRMLWTGAIVIDLTVFATCVTAAIFIFIA